MNLNYKLKLLALLLVAGFYKVDAQISIETLSMEIGQSTIYSTDSLFTTDLQAEGTNLTWDFSGLHGQKLDTTQIVNPSSTPFASVFPTANIAMKEGPANLYMSLNNEAMVALGAGGSVAGMGNDFSMKLNPADTILRFPLNYLDEAQSFGYGSTPFSVTISGMPLTGRVSHSSKRTQKVDAWGSMTTPIGTFDVLRVKEKVISTDSVFIILFGMESFRPDQSQFDTSYIYTFYAKTSELQFMLASAEFNPADNSVKSIRWQKTPVTSVDELEADKQWAVYPNPAQNLLKIQCDEPTFKVRIYNSVGQLVTSQENTKTFNVEDYTQGVYLLQLESNKGTSVKKFVVSR